MPATNSRTFSDSLVSWYQTVKRDLPWRHTSDPYAIWVSEVMLQQTQVKTVIPYYLDFLARFPSPVHLAKAELEEVLSAWRGLGYYSRARHLWEGAGYVVETLGGEVPKDYAGLRQIPGVGEYTAGAIASIAFGQAVPAIDGNVRRILSRILAWPHPVESALSRQKFHGQLSEWMPTGIGGLEATPGDFNQALMELGATLCLPKNPRCPSCPVSAWCQAHMTGDMNYPIKRSKNKPVAVIRLTFVLMHAGRVYLQKRPSEGLLADLWEFPGIELEAEAQDKTLPEVIHFSLYQRAVSDRSYDKEALAFFNSAPALHGPVRHTFSHRHWNLYWFILPIKGEALPNIVRESPLAVENRWLSLPELDAAPIPTAFRKITESLKTR